MDPVNDLVCTRYLSLHFWNITTSWHSKMDQTHKTYFKRHLWQFPFFPVTQSLYAFIKEDATDFKLDRIPAHSGWVYQFTVHALQTRNISTDVMYFVYPANTVHCAKSVTQELSLDDLSCFPRDFFFSSRTYQPHNKKLFLLNRGEKLPYGIALEEYHNCCHETVNVTEYFFANVSLDRKLISELILSCLYT